MASTITRDTWTDDPTGVSGTVINNAVLQNHIYARVDAMFAGAGSYATLAFGGLIKADGFGDHIFQASGTGTAPRIVLSNPTAGTGNAASYALGSDEGQVGALSLTSSTFTGLPSTVQLHCGSVTANAMIRIIAASHASARVRIHTASQFWDFTGDGKIGYGRTSPGALLDFGVPGVDNVIHLYNDLVAANGAYGFGIASQTLRIYNGSGGQIDFGTYASGAFTLKIRIDAAGDIFPSGATRCGTTANKWKEVHTQELTTGDITFSNGWKLIETDKVGLSGEGMVLQNANGVNVLVIDEEGIRHVADRR